ncbi:RING-H2 finger protein ATL32 [Rhynchospora pubera]|uniref:RING-type E3 ubiquitin transferase n=1 Tax=Rhynchospora pubera TaxID=906938 RepID=A0AAV8C0E1_9POAL|nr:RING-H2 finger protein ATL32 [Rhynchospora pubera]
MFHPRIEYSYRHPRHPIFNEAVLVTVVFFIVSIVSFLVLLFFTGFLWAFMFIIACVVLSAFYIDWLRRAPDGPLLVQTLPHEYAPVRVGLDSSAIAALPSFQYQRYCHCAVHDGSDSNGWLQCAICIGMLQIGEMVRSIPACKHLFHVECIDMWLKSHSTCPLCRATVAPADATSNLDAQV